MRQEYEEKKHIVFMGIKHCGKSTLGKYTAGQLNFPFVDLDDKICLLYNNGNKSPREIYREEGSSFFRELELAALKTILAMGGEKKAVIALGGGMIDNKEGMKLIGKHGHLIYLEEQPDVLYERITRSGKPAFFEEDKDTYAQFLELYNKRSFEYEQYADDKVFLNNRGREAAQQYLIRQLKIKEYVR